MPYQKVRRGGRISIAVPILLIGNDLRRPCVLRGDLFAFTEPASCLVTNSFPSRNWFSALSSPIAGEIGIPGDFHAYGVAFVDETLDFWKINSLRQRSSRNRLVSLSNAQVVAPQLSYWSREISNFDVCGIHGGLVRYRDHCGFAAVGKFASEAPAASPQPQQVASAQEQATRCNFRGYASPSTRHH